MRFSRGLPLDGADKFALCVVLAVSFALLRSGGVLQGVVGVLCLLAGTFRIYRAMP